jgi:hypothetical protein
MLVDLMSHRCDPETTIYILQRLESVRVNRTLAFNRMIHFRQGELLSDSMDWMFDSVTVNA